MAQQSLPFRKASGPERGVLFTEAPSSPEGKVGRGQGLGNSPETPKRCGSASGTCSCRARWRQAGLWRQRDRADFQPCGLTHFMSQSLSFTICKRGAASPGSAAGTRHQEHTARLSVAWAGAAGMTAGAASQEGGRNVFILTSLGAGRRTALGSPLTCRCVTSEG